MRQHPRLDRVKVFVGVLRVDAGHDLRHHDPDQTAVQIKAQRLVDLAKRKILVHVLKLFGGIARGEERHGALIRHSLFHGLQAGQEPALKVHGLAKELLRLGLAAAELFQHVFAELSVDRDGGGLLAVRVIIGRVRTEHDGSHDVQNIGEGVLGVAHNHVRDHRRAV